MLTDDTEITGKPDDSLAANGDSRDLPAEAEAARAEAAEWREKYLRLLAEFDNFRKRVRSDIELQRNFATESLIAALLPIVDDLDRMLATTADVDDPYRRGAELIREKLHNFLRSRGVLAVESLGAPFNPTEHDALLMRPTADFPPGTVLEVIVPGYRMGDRMVRHAQVVVSEAPEAVASGEQVHHQS